MWARETTFPLSFWVWRYTDRWSRTQEKWHGRPLNFNTKLHNLHWTIS